MSEEHLTDEEYLKDIYDYLHDLIEYCIESKENIEDMDNWEIVHDLEFQLELAFESLKNIYLKWRLKNDNKRR